MVKSDDSFVGHVFANFNDEVLNVLFNVLFDYCFKLPRPDHFFSLQVIQNRLNGQDGKLGRGGRRINNVMPSSVVTSPVAIAAATVAIVAATVAIAR